MAMDRLGPDSAARTVLPRVTRKIRSSRPLLGTRPSLSPSSPLPHSTRGSFIMSSSTTVTNNGAKPNAQYDVPPSVFTLRRTAQLEALYTIIRDKNTSRGDFIFYSDRIIRLLVEEGLNYLPVVPKNVETPTVRAPERTLTLQLSILNACRGPVTKVLVLRERSAACPFCARGRCVC